ncbi:sushi, von Willebrand factor type A, EGF and pentraxin domain-containing protein 1 [Elysia marginata]|uniref:Sushi, von Willebrand factor type A, EGF and pentraxin domain-containing protein 1 n=1 Tax=Elysia marginata TaxID=1093978 RepID=A0AAV4JE78_9GAST|nr:sushi, von Willebrand factor type A, EGF and pentraxin domain-containing protein 1 [Elysia marginata]
MTSTCQGSSGKWSPMPGPCTVVSCGAPKSLDFMKFELTTRPTDEAFPSLTNETLAIAYGGVAVYSCSEGYTRPDAVSYISQCLADGTWSSTANFLCSPVDCGQPPLAANTDHTSHAITTFGQNITVKCKPGFSPTEGFRLTCGATGTWEGPEVVCEPIKCSTPPELKNATVAFNSTDVGAKATYQCVEPAMKDGEDNSTAECKENGDWSSVGLHCSTIPCGPPPPVNHSTFYFLNQYNLIFVRYVCDEGFVPAAQMARLCGDTWSNNDVWCTSIQCGPVPQVNNASVTTTGNKYQDTAHFTCHPGYSLTSSLAVMTCTANGTWAPEDVTCAPMTCDSTMLPPFSEIVEKQQLSKVPTIIQKPALRQLFEHGDDIEIKCMVGYLLFTTQAPHTSLKSTNLKCQAGNWTLSSSQDVLCVHEHCNNIPSISNAVSELKGDLEVKYYCPVGYGISSKANQVLGEVVEPTTEFSIYCDINTGWSVPNEVQSGCGLVGCGPMELPFNIELQAPATYSTVLGSKVALSCRPPLYQAIPDAKVNSVALCLGDGNWTLPDDFTLICAPCNQNPEAMGIPNGVIHITPNADGSNISDSARLTCAPDFVLLGGPRALHCVSVEGSPTWNDIENATCLQNRWVSENGAFAAPVYIELLKSGLEACVDLKFTEAYRFRMGLEKAGFENSFDMFPARVEYFHRHRDRVRELEFKHSDKISPDHLVTEVFLKNTALFKRGEEASLCLKLDIIENVYQVKYYPSAGMSSC